MRQIKYIVLILTVLIQCSFASCNSDEPLVNYQSENPGIDPESDDYIVICDFETKDIEFKTNDALVYTVVENIDTEGENKSKHYGQVISAGGQWELIYSETIPEALNFTKNGAKFTMKICAPKVNGKVYFKLEGDGVQAYEITDVLTTTSGHWETLSFDFTSLNLTDDKYNRIILLFDAGETGTGETWLFDDIFQMKGENAEPEPDYMYNYCDFEDVVIDFNLNPNNGTIKYEIIDNPYKTGINTSSKVGRVVSGGNQWELLWSNPLPNMIDFSENAVFTLDVYSPKNNGKVYFKLEGDGVQSGEITNVVVTKANEWTKLKFDFSTFNLPSNKYNKIVLLFDAGETSLNENWYFDNIRGPKMIAITSLMQRSGDNPVFTYGIDKPLWRNEHIANAAILTPTESPDGKWRMYIRGSGYNTQNEYHDQIGIFYQENNNFNPTGPWIEHPSNPIITSGVPGAPDELHLLDCAPCIGANENVYFFYQAVRGTLDNKKGSLAVRHSQDGGYSFTDATMLRDKVGCSDAVFYDNKYYIFYGYNYGEGKMKIDCAITSDPLSIANATVHTVLMPGAGPANFDSRSVNGSRIFRLSEINKWFMVYQGSDIHFDFPYRMHIAYSDDLLNWTKVNNSQPFFTRGDEGKWDQGAIWFGEVFEYQDILYMYYEGWGCEMSVENRDEPYFAYGHSSTGCASVNKDDFLKWCGLK